MNAPNGNEIKAYFNLDNLSTSYVTVGDAVMIAIEATKEKEYIRVSVQAKLDNVSTTIFPKLNIMNASGSVGHSIRETG
jgi:hypothetical protein